MSVKKSAGFPNAPRYEDLKKAAEAFESVFAEVLMKSKRDVLDERGIEGMPDRRAPREKRFDLKFAPRFRR